MEQLSWIYPWCNVNDTVGCCFFLFFPVIPSQISASNTSEENTNVFFLFEYLKYWEDFPCI